MKVTGVSWSLMYSCCLACKSLMQFVEWNEIWSWLSSGVRFYIILVLKMGTPQLPLALNTYPSFSMAPFLDLQCHPSQGLPSGTAKLITQAQCRLLLRNGASADSSWEACLGPQTHLPGRPSFVPGQRQDFPGCCLLHAAPFSFSTGQVRRPQSALGEGLEGWRGPYPGLPPPPIHLGVKHILFPHVWGLRGLPLQDYFLLQFVFQLETLGAPRQGGGSSAVAREASKDPE